MTALERIFVGASRDGDLYLQCYDCCWIHDLEDVDLPAVINVAAHHHCQPEVVSGKLDTPSPT